MAKYAIQGETLAAIADAVRDNLGILPYPYIIRSDVVDSACALRHNSVIINYWEYIDCDEQSYNGIKEGGRDNDVFVEYDYYANNEGISVPVIFKTDVNGFADEADYGDVFYYVGTAEIDGTVYDKWQKIEEDGMFGWDTSARHYVYTDIIVEKNNDDVQISPMDIPSRVYDVHRRGYAEGIEVGKQTAVEEDKIIVKTVSGIGSLTIDDVSELPHDIQCQLEPAGTLFDINKYAIVNDYIGFDISNLAMGFKYVFTSNLPLGWFKISNNASGYTSVAKEGSFTKFTFTMARNANIPANSEQYLFLGSAPSFAFKSIDQLNGYILSISVDSTETSSWCLKANDTDYTADENRIVTGIKSSSPVMRFASPYKMTVTYHQSYGTIIEWNRFWDNYQKNGKETMYNFFFSGTGWTEKTFKPKYDITLGLGYTGMNVFMRNAVTDLAETLERLGIKLDTSKCGSMSQMFQESVTKRIPELNCTHTHDYGDYGLSHTFTRASVETIDKMIVNENTRFTNTFQECANLKEIRFEGTVGNNINLQWSTKLSKASIASLASCLIGSKDITITLSKVAVDKAFETSEGANDGSENFDFLYLITSWVCPYWTVNLI